MILATCFICLGGGPDEPLTLPWPATVGRFNQADAAQPFAREDPPNWSFVIEPFLWLAGIDGEGGNGSAPPVGIGESLSLFGDIDGGFLLALEAKAPGGRFSVLGDGLFLSLADDEGSLQTDTGALMLELGVGLPFSRGSKWEATFGLRYVDLDFDAELNGNPIVNAEQDWIDPWIGARGEIPLSEHWALGLRADVGGFGVGTQLTWQALAGVRANLGKSVRFDLGYRAISLDFDDSGLEYDALIHGAFIGIAFEL